MTISRVTKVDRNVDCGRAFKMKKCVVNCTALWNSVSLVDNNLALLNFPFVARI